MAETYPAISIGLDKDIGIALTKSSAWAAAAQDGTWTWTLKIDQNRTPGGTPVLTHNADTLTLSNSDKTLTLTFNIPDTKTTLLTAGQNSVELVSDDGSGKVLPYPDVAGTVSVIQPLGSA